MAYELYDLQINYTIFFLTHTNRNFLLWLNGGVLWVLIPERAIWLSIHSCCTNGQVQH